MLRVQLRTSLISSIEALNIELKGTINMISVEWILLYFMLGGFVGFMAGLLGVGGGGILRHLAFTHTPVEDCSLESGIWDGAWNYSRSISSYSCRSWH